MTEPMADDTTDQVYHDGHRMVRRVEMKHPTPGRQVPKTRGGAHAFYEVVTDSGEGDPEGQEVIGTLDFQHDTIPAVGVKAWTNESVLSVVIDRLEGFQAGEFACEANETALGYIRQGLVELEARTKDRKERGVEGKHEA